MEHTRHSGIFDISQISTTIIGAGGIGATTALTLAKMGLRRLTVFDDDVVSPENLATQLHRHSDTGTEKVWALQGVLNQFSDELQFYNGYAERVTAESYIADEFVISAVDSITARQDIWQALLKPWPKSVDFKWYLDARMAAEEFQLHIVNENDIRWYDDLITHEDEKAIPDLACTEKATVYCGFIGAGIIGSTIRKIVTGVKLPHKIIYNIRTSTLMEL